MNAEADVVLVECTLDAPPERVWRALTIPEYLQAWLQPEGPLDLTVMSENPNRSVTYHWRDNAADAVGGLEEGVVTFEIAPNENGGTWFRLTHAPLLAPVAANENGLPTLMLAA
jgi:uncharacterized protein YndB with AHSA1/START domain